MIRGVIPQSGCKNNTSGNSDAVGDAVVQQASTGGHVHVLDCYSFGESASRKIVYPHYRNVPILYVPSQNGREQRETLLVAPAGLLAACGGGLQPVLERREQPLLLAAEL